MITRARSRGLPTTPIAAALLTSLLGGVTSAYGGTLTVAWDPSPDSSVVGYRVYVGMSSGVYTEIYDVGSATTFSYYAAEGSRYYFAVAAYAAGPIIGARSSEVTALAASAGEPASFWSSIWGSKAVASGLHTSTSPTRRISPSSTAATPDGRTLFVDEGRRVRAITRRGVARESVIIAERSTTLNQIAMDPRFAATGLMWVGETRLSADGRRTFAVVRYRVVNNRAGQRVEIVSGITLPPSGNALFVIGESGHIYVAVPGSPDGSKPFWGTVMRFNPDGSVPEDHRTGSPVIGTGYAFPHAIALEPLNERVLLSGLD